MGCDFLVIVCSCQNKGVDSLSLYSLISNFDRVMARTSENLNDGAKRAVTSRIPTKREQSLSKKNQQLEVENFLLKRQLRTETELKYMFGLFILEDELTDRFNEWNKKGRPEHTDSWKNECLRHIKENLLPNGIRELALKIENK